MTRSGERLRAWLGGVLLLGGLGCGASPDSIWQWIETAEGQGEPGHSRPPRAMPEVDSRISRECLDAQLTAYLEAIGAGWPASYRPTGTVFVSAAHQTLYSQGFGTADAELASPNTADTSFRVGSITKGFTAVAILQLVEAGQLALEDTIGEHLAQYPAVGAGITMHQLLSHTSGLPNYTEDAELMARRDEAMTPEQLMATFWDEPLNFEPGSEFRYSNSGYVVLGAVIEQLSGQSYAEYMQQAVFEPAGLWRTTVGDAEQLEDRAHGYTSDLRGARVLASPIDLSVPYAAGAIRSTAQDLARWHYVLGTDRLLNAHSRQLLTTPVLNGYAYGWGIGEQNGLELVTHNGGIDGFLSSLVRVPELDLAIVVLLNADTVDPGPISDAALRCALGEDLEPSPPPALVDLDDSQRDQLLGTYLLTQESRQLFESLGLSEGAIEALASVDIRAEAGDLLFDLVGYDPNLMLATSEADFLLPAVNAQAHFSFANGESLPATDIEIQEGGVAYTFER